ncbi:MAG: AsmA family protein [Deltaproteobacteria bacterium]|nr:MAG: AsmA family protein [Deltaproteobacteria bacterium]
MRKFLIALIIFLSLIFLVALFLPRVINLDQYKPALISMVEKRINGKVNMSHIELTILDGLGARLHEFEILNTDRFNNSPFLRAKRLEMKVGVLPLLAGKINAKLIIEAPQILLEKDREGVFSFKELIKGPESTVSPKESLPPSEILPATNRFSITALNVKNGRVAYIDHTPHTTEPKALILDDFHLKLDNLSLAKPVRFELALGKEESASDGVRLEGKARVDTENRRIDLQDTFLNTGSLILELGGKVDDYRVHPIFDLGFSSNQFDPAQVLSLYSPVANKVPPGLSFSGLSSLKGSIYGGLGNLLIKSRIECSENTINYGKIFKKAKGVPANFALSLMMSKGSIIVNEMELNLVTLRLKGTGSVNNLRDPKIDLRAATNGIELKGWEGMFPFLKLSKLTGSVKLDIAAEIGIKEEEKLSCKGNIFLNEIGASVPWLAQDIEGLNGELGFSSDSVFSQALSLKLGNSDINLDFEVNDFENPVVSFDLSSGRLDLDELLPKSLGKEIGGEREAPPETKSSKGMDLLDRAEVRGKMRVGQGKFRNLSFENLFLTLMKSKKLVNLSNLSFDLYEGTYQGTGKLDMGEQEPTYIFQSQMHEVKIHEMLSLFPSLEGLISGFLSAELSLSGKGVNFESFSKSLSGTGKISLSGGMISNISLEKSLSNLSRLKGWKNESDGTHFDTLESQVAISEGRVNASDLKLNTSDMSVIANGYFDRNRRLNYQAQAVLSRQLSQRLEGGNGGEFFKDESDRIIIPFRLEGTVDDPGFSLNREDLEKGKKERALRKTEEELNRAINKDLNQ